MLRIWRRLAAASVLALGVTIAACSDRSPAPLAPDEASFTKGWGKGGKAGPETQAVETLSDGTVKGWKLAKGHVRKNAALKDEKVIGRDGGYLYSSGHYLVVPEGAVSAPTVFRMVVTRPITGDSAVVSVSLKAYRVVGTDTVNVGKSGFAVPVQLYVYYGHSDVADPSATRVLWIKEPGVVEPVQEFKLFLEHKWILGKLHHFSEYGIGWPNAEEDSEW